MEPPPPIGPLFLQAVRMPTCMTFLLDKPKSYWNFGSFVSRPACKRLEESILLRSGEFKQGDHFPIQTSLSSNPFSTRSLWWFPCDLKLHHTSSCRTFFLFSQPSLFTVISILWYRKLSHSKPTLQLSLLFYRLLQLLLQTHFSKGTQSVLSGRLLRCPRVMNV